MPWTALCLSSSRFFLLYASQVGTYVTQADIDMATAADVKAESASPEDVDK